jgi:threonine dehydrogenase-like Zn-dependent dehydrogenase
MRALRIDRKVAKFAAARIMSSMAPGRGAAYGPLELVDIDPPKLPADGWQTIKPRLSGICGSDLATIDGAASRYFEPIISFPFVPGHEIVADTEDGRRVVVVPVLHCATRGISPVCDMCLQDRINLCERTAFGHLSPGLQCGFCTDTGGGWSTQMVAHESQLVEIPDDFTDEQAVMVEPMACAVHAASWYHGQDTAIIGAGTLGLLTLAALTAQRDPERSGPIVVTARYPHQKAFARQLGATHVCDGDELPRVVRSLSGSMAVGDQLTCGFDQVIDCVGSSDSLAQALQVVAPGGDILMVGMPGVIKTNLTGLWHREVSLRGCYAYDRADFDTAIELVRRFDLGRLVSQTYPLADYETAIEHAANAGRRGAVKIAFDLRQEKKR